MDKIVILDFGGQYCHLISRRIRDLGVLAEVVPSDVSANVLQNDKTIKGIILSGGARSVYEKNAPVYDESIFKLKVPLLGICYGHQLIAHELGGDVVSGKSGEYGITRLHTLKATGILKGIKKETLVWMNHRDIVTKMPEEFEVYAKTLHSPVAAFGSKRSRIYGVQFHPEVSHTKEGQAMLKQFVETICSCKPSRSTYSIVETLIDESKKTLGQSKAVIGLSGGIDSSVAAMLVSKAVGDRLVAVYVDTGLMRYHETQEIKKAFAKEKLKLIVVDAKTRFFSALKGVTSPERKRKIIGKLFVEIFEEQAKKEQASFLIQGTIYSDRIESGLTKHSSTIKSHHNVGGLPKKLKLKLYEPLRDLYKDEVRKIAKELELTKELMERQVFPGPGLAIRVVGEVTEKKVDIVRRAHKIIQEELKPTTYWKNIWMSFAVLLSLKSVGIQGDERSYKYPVVVRIIESKDAMTANFSKLPYEILERISTRITNEIQEVNRVVYDITNKPPATMEWE